MVGIARFNALPAVEAERELRACCASTRWVEKIVAGRPYASAPALRAAGEAAVEGLAWGDVAEALAPHPRVGERPAGLSLEDSWSGQEQSGVRPDSDLAAVNREYEERFGHVFLIFATGRSAADVLAAARSRLGNPVEKERLVVRGELARIVGLRLSRLVAS